MNFAPIQSKKLKIIVGLVAIVITSLVLGALTLIITPKIFCQNTKVIGSTTMRIAKEYRRERPSFSDVLRELHGAGEAQIIFVSRIDENRRYEIISDYGGGFKLVIPQGPYRVFFRWGEKDAAFSQRYSFDVEISGCQQTLNVGTNGSESGTTSDGRSNFRFNERE